MQFLQLQKQASAAGAGSALTQKALWDTDEGQRRRTMGFILSSNEQHSILSGTQLILLYLSIFLCAEGAFVLMALREYLQEALKLSERDVIEQIASPVGE
jgi:hypothetical protein